MWDFSDRPDPISSLLPTKNNHLLRQLAVADRVLLERRMECAPVAAGTVLIDVGQPLDTVYFPVDAVISIEQSSRMEVATVGREGMFGWSAMAEHQRSPFRAVVRGRNGLLLTSPVASAVSAMSESPRLRAMLCRYLVIVAIHMSETIDSHCLHRLEVRLARWLLVHHDRVAGDEIRAQHDQIADSLGVRRASITDCLHIIEGEGHIRCRRGRITMRDRAPLEQMARGCYGAAEAHYRSSFGSFGKGRVQSLHAIAAA